MACRLVLLMILLVLCLWHPSNAAAIPTSKTPSKTHFRKSLRRRRNSLTPAFTRATEVVPSTGRFAAPTMTTPSSKAFFTRRLLAALGMDSFSTTDEDDYEFDPAAVEHSTDRFAAQALSRAEVDGDSEDGELLMDGPDDSMGTDSEGEIIEPAQQDEQNSENTQHQQEHHELAQEKEPQHPAKTTSSIDVSKTIRAASSAIDEESSDVEPEQNLSASRKETRTAQEKDADAKGTPSASGEDSGESKPKKKSSQKKSKTKPSKPPSDKDDDQDSGGGRGGQGEEERAKQFNGVDLGVVDGTNITHLSYMVFKIIKEYDIRSMVDIPCRNTLQWFPELLHQIDFEVIGFKYYCVDSDNHSQDDIRHLFSDAGGPEFLHIRPEEAHLLPKTDLMFSWDGPQQWGVKRTWSFFTALREIRPSYLLITNNPKVSNTNDERGVINLRKQPFHDRFANCQRQKDRPAEMAEEKEKVYRFGPAIFSTPERWRARFNVGYQARDCAQLAFEGKPTPADVEKYATAFPEEGERLHKIYSLSRFTGLSTVAGFLGGGAYALRATRNPPLVAVTTLLSAFTSHVVSDDIGSWIYGTYKFDNGSTNERFLRWVRDSRLEATN